MPKNRYSTLVTKKIPPKPSHEQLEEDVQRFLDAGRKITVGASPGDATPRRYARVSQAGRRPRG